MDLRPPKTEPSKLGSTHKKTSGRRKWLRRFLLLVSLVCIGVGVYIAVLLLSPQVDLPVKSDVDLNTADDTSDARDRIQIEKINLEVPFYTGGAEALEKGAWHRFPDRGDPEKGGNFILSAHRFRIAGDPILTREQSPFYNLDKLVVGDKLRIFYKNEWYSYEVTKTYSVNPNAVEIEDPSSEAKLTLYSCTLSGSADGRIVIEAKEVE